MTISSTQDSSQNIVFTTRATQLMNARQINQANRDTFAQVLEKTANLTPSNAKDILNGLSSAEKESVRAVHSLANSFYIPGLSEEGAYNLLCQPGSSKDLDNNGLLSIGAALIYQFPPPNAPAGVQKAWEETTAGKSNTEKMLLQMSFLPMEISANVKYDANHQAIGVYSPDEPGYTNIYAQPGFSYLNLVKQLREYLDNTRGYMTADQYQTRTDFASNFEAALVRNGAS